MINAFVLVHLAKAFLFFFNFPINTPGSSSANPTPPNECNVIPPILQAAIPVDAVTATASGLFACFFLSPAMISLSKTDLPVPMSQLYCRTQQDETYQLNR
jgi:hypothetical protein